jgi:hypothetical protein
MPQREKRKLFAQHQESARKDVQQAFGLLQSRVEIIHGPTCAWHMETLRHIIYACDDGASYDILGYVFSYFLYI